MKKMRLVDGYLLSVKPEYSDIKNVSEDYTGVTFVCFENNFSEEKYYIKLLNEDWVDKVILIGAKPTSCFGEKLIKTNTVKEKFFKNTQNVIFIINTDIDEDVLKPIVDTFNIAKKLGINIGVSNIIGFSNYVNDTLIVSLQALLQDDAYKQYEIVYDYICDELDKKFSDNSICRFENDRCIANRKYYNKDKIMGCCYSFKYNGLQFSDVKLCEHQKNSRCEVKCLGCKLFTCDYLKKHGIRFSLENMPIALAFFSKKQREILRTTFFTTKDDVISKVINCKR